MKIVHTYRIGNQLRNVEKRLTGPAAYTLDCPAEPENVSVTLEVPHADR
jgi:hypothetical protein